MEEPVLVYTDASGVDAGSVGDFELDMEFGTDGQSCDFEATFAGPRLKGGELVYIDATEYGGVVDQVETLSTSEAATYRGRTWHGVLACKVISPDSGKDYYTLSGDLNACIRTVVSRLGLTGLFRGRAGSCGISVTNYQFERYVDAYKGLCALCASKGAVLRMAHAADTSGGRVELWAEARRTAGDDECDSDVMEVGITENHRVVNHLVCLGEGELKDRVVVHLYADASGDVSQAQTLKGRDEVAEVYDYSGADRETLVEKGTERLKEYQVAGSVTADAVDAASYDWHVGDLLSAADMAHDRQVTAPVVGKVVKVSMGVLTVDYAVGDATGAVGTVMGPGATASGKAALEAAKVAQQSWSEAYRAGELSKRAVVKTAVLYSAGTKDGPGRAWSESVPEWRDGGVLWEKLVTTYATGTVEEARPSISDAEWATPADVEEVAGTAGQAAQKAEQASADAAVAKAEVASATEAAGQASAKAEEAKVEAAGAKADAAAATSKADGAQQAAEAAGAKADEAKGEASDAAKVATNFIGYGDDGLVVGDLTGNSVGTNTNIRADGVRIRQGAVDVAKFSMNEVDLGIASNEAHVYLCGRVASVQANIYGNGERAATLYGTDGVELRISGATEVNPYLYLRKLAANGFTFGVQSDRVYLAPADSGSGGTNDVQYNRTMADFVNRLLSIDGWYTAIMATNLNALWHPCLFAWNPDTVGIPVSGTWGMGICIANARADTTGNWAYQLAKTTSDTGEVWVRQSINTGGWTSWRRAGWDDTGWRKLAGTYDTPVGHDGTNGLYYRKTGQTVTVYVNGGATWGPSITTAGTVLGTLPAGYRPDAMLCFMLAPKGAGAHRLEVYPNGQIKGVASGSATAYYAATATFPV